MCEWGHESVESWGRRRRSIASNHTSNESEDDMTLSQEILVLDFGDEKNSQFLRSEASSSDFGKGERPDTFCILSAINNSTACS